jgi:hypothetical protein
VAEALPDARFVVVLREPVARAWSHLRMLQDRGWSDETSLRRAVEQGSAGVEPQRRRRRHHWTRPYGRYVLFERGLYAEQLERWFGQLPREQFLIVRFEDLFGDHSEATYGSICEFIGLDPGFTPSPTHLNRGLETPLAAEEAEWLAERYREPNRALQELVGISWDDVPVVR